MNDQKYIFTKYFYNRCIIVKYYYYLVFYYNILVSIYY